MAAVRGDGPARAGASHDDAARDDTGRRRYHSPARRLQAERTRSRILCAARELFRSGGYAATTLEAIAKSAQVSVKTVEAGFGSKRGILLALVDPLASAGLPRELIGQLRAEAEPRQRLRLVAQLCRRAYEASAPELELLRGASVVAPEIGVVAVQVESRRREYQSRLIAYLTDQDMLRADLDSEQATDILWALSSYDMYRALVISQHWPAERYEAWLDGALVISLIEQ